jgi:prepilin peptidase CpaA
VKAGPPVFVGSPFRVGAGIVFLVLLVLVCLADIRTRRIPNALVAVLAVCGLAFSMVSAPLPRGLIAGVGGLLVGLAIWLPSWLFRLLGAGDVKFFAAAGAWLGVRGALEGSIFAAFAGGLLALIWMLRFRGLKGSALTIWAAGVRPSSLVQPVQARSDLSAAHALPYTVALAVGAGVASWFPHLIF